MPTIVSNANVYINGRNLVGVAKEVQLPEIEVEVGEHEALGLYGTPEYPLGIQPMESTITWATFDPRFAEPFGNIWQSHLLEIFASIESYTSVGRTESKQLKILMRGRFKKIPLGTFTQKEMAEFESDLSVDMIKQVYDGTTLLEVDVPSNIWKVRGVDRLANFRANLALT